MSEKLKRRPGGRQLVVLAFVALCGIGVASVGGFELSLAGGGLAFTALAVGALLLAGRRSAHWVDHYNQAYAMWARGDLAGAHAALAKLPAGKWKGWMGIAAGNLESILHMGQGQIDEARAAAERALVPRTDLFSRLNSSMTFEHISLAHGARALAAAGQGDDAAVREEAAWMRGHEAASPHARARVELARAVIHARNDDRARLAEVMRESKQITEFLQPRERTLFRALRQMLRVDPSHVYRQRGNVVQDAEETDLRAWMNRLVPRSAELLPEPTAHVSPAGRLESAPLVSPAEGAEERTKARTRLEASVGAQTKRAKRRVMKLTALWLLLVGGFLIAFAIITSPPPHAAVHAPATYPPWMTTTLYMAGAMATCLALIMGRLRWALSVQAKIRRASTLSSMGKRSEALAIVEPMTRSFMAGAKAPALLIRARDRSLHLQFAEALADCDAALALFSSSKENLESQTLLPEVYAERAFALAALARTRGGAHFLADAGETLLYVDENWPTFVYRDRTNYRVETMLALAERDYARAADLAAARSSTLPVGYRDDMLAELMVLAVHGGGSTEETLALLGEVESDTELRAWLLGLAPEVVEAVRARRLLTSARTRVAEDDAVSAAPEDDAEEEEALADDTNAAR